MAKENLSLKLIALYGMSLAVENGAGIAALPDYMVADKPHYN